MTLQQAELALQQLFLGGAFRFADNIATVSYDEYKHIIESIEPAEEYSIGYDLSGINWLENCHLDRDDTGCVEVIRRERTWTYGPMQAFQLELTTVPKLIMVTSEPNEPTILDTTWYVDANGRTRAYLQSVNGVELENLRG